MEIILSIRIDLVTRLHFIFSIFLIAFISNATQSNTTPEILNIQNDDGNPTTITIKWSPPKQVDGQIVNYIILYSKDKTLNDRKWNKKQVSGDVTTTIVDGLSPNTNYFFKIKARIDQELSTASPVQQFKTAEMRSLAVPKISKMVYLTDPRKVTLHFLPPSQPKGQIQGYYVFYTQDVNLTDDKWDKVYVSGDVTNGVLENLSLGSTYFIKIQVKTDEGLGLSTSSIFRFTTRDGPINEELNTKPHVAKSQNLNIPKITKVDLLTDPTRVIVNFLPPTKPKGHIKGYYIFYTEDITFPDAKWDKIYINGDVTSGQLDNLSPRSTYFIKMQVKTDEGIGPITPSVARFNTKQALIDVKSITEPDAKNKLNNTEQPKSTTSPPLKTKTYSPTTPIIVRVVPSPYDPTVVTLFWSPPKEPNGQIIGYYVFYSKNVHLPDLKWDIEFVKGVETTGQLNDLQPNNKYFFKIQVKTDEGLSSLSDVFEFKPDNSNIKQEL